MRLNPQLENLPVYQPGRPLDEVAREIGLPAANLIKLASNENPLGPSPRVTEALRVIAADAHRYPDGSSFYLKRALAERLGIDPAQLILGNGSNDILEFVAHALLSPGDEVVMSEYCFAVYPIVTHLFGARPVVVSARNYGHDLLAMLDAINERTRIVFVANPNNPTGTIAPMSEVQKMIDQMPDHVLLVMDEAYIEYLEQPCNLIPHIRPNLIITRTFSKIHGLAGLRCGYGIGHREFIDKLEKIRQPFNLNSPAQAAAMAALEDEDHVQRSRQTNKEGLVFFENTFRKAGLQFIPSHANFTLVHVGDGASVFCALQQRGVITRPMAGYQLPEWIRITIGTKADNERCLAALRDVMPANFTVESSGQSA